MQLIERAIEVYDEERLASQVRRAEWLVRHEVEIKETVARYFDTPEVQIFDGGYEVIEDGYALRVGSIDFYLDDNEELFVTVRCRDCLWPLGKFCARHGTPTTNLRNLGEIVIRTCKAFVCQEKRKESNAA